MNNAVELLMLLVFFVPIGAMVLLNLAMYREARYVAQPPAPAMSATAATKPAIAEEYDFDFRQAA
jgi:hypothetical protein